MARSILKRIIGGLMLVLGVAGLFLPLTPGILFILIGLELVGLGYLIPQKIREKAKQWKDSLKKKLGME